MNDPAKVQIKIPKGHLLSTKGEIGGLDECDPAIQIYTVYSIYIYIVYTHKQSDLLNLG